MLFLFFAAAVPCELHSLGRNGLDIEFVLPDEGGPLRSFVHGPYLEISVSLLQSFLYCPAMFTIKSMVPAYEPQILRVGIDDAPPVPVQMGAPESGDFRGFEVSLLEELAQHIGCTLQYRRALWSVIVAELSTGKLDLVCSAATVTAERAHQVDFCKPHLELAGAADGRADELS
jgi:ABC-type amino acid transport substrate-binding protein